METSISPCNDLCALLAGRELQACVGQGEAWVPGQGAKARVKPVAEAMSKGAVSISRAICGSAPPGTRGHACSQAAVAAEKGGGYDECEPLLVSHSRVHSNHTSQAPAWTQTGICTVVPFPRRERGRAPNKIGFHWHSVPWDKAPEGTQKAQSLPQRVTPGKMNAA